jgi:aryl-alcohol dehydrogenase-like predicted oxidoreductase
VIYDITPQKHFFSERILGKAIKELKLPRDEIVIMTKADLSFFFVMYLY